MKKFKKRYGNFILGSVVVWIICVLYDAQVFLLECLPIIGFVFILLILAEALSVISKPHWKLQRNWWIIGLALLYAFVSCFCYPEELTLGFVFPWIVGAIRVLTPYQVAEKISSWFYWD